MARFSFKGNPALTDELFAQAMACDKGIHECALAGGYCDSHGHQIGKYVDFPSWEDVHDITDEQIAIAKENYQRRRTEELSGIKRGEIVFVAMGCDYTPKIENGVGNHRMRCDFCNSAGEQFFVEFCSCHPDPDKGFYIDFSIDRQLEKQYKDEQEARYERNKNLPIGKRENTMIPQYYYNAKGVQKKSFAVPFTWDNVVKFINETYGCNYQSGRLFRYFIRPEDYVCKC